ncbi:MAG: hypothetical protein R3350_06960 [Saprospiraceae bacterium]|nr:hypothetical protein [Saprospiraceae bacterium]
MQNASKNLYRRKQFKVYVSEKIKDKASSVVEKKAVRPFSRNLINAMSWLVFLGGWVWVYLSSGQPLFPEVLSAYLLITCMLFMKAMD